MALHEGSVFAPASDCIGSGFRVMEGREYRESSSLLVPYSNVRNLVLNPMLQDLLLLNS